jgi:thiazole synthase ThiGH ThiG subunit
MPIPKIQHIAGHMGGEVHTGRQALVPGPDHSTVDRSPSISINDAGFDVLVFAGDDPIECKNLARQKLPMADGQAYVWGQSNGRGSAQAAVDAMTKAAPTPIGVG